MKTGIKSVQLSVLALSLQSVLAMWSAAPTLAFAEDDVTALTMPSNSVEVGVENISASSPKFGEYNGLNKSGDKLIGNVDVRGGSAYGQGSGNTRWELKGYDLGTTSGGANAAYSEQGRWSLGISFDELQHNITDSFQTPFAGTMGGNRFTLPTTFGVINSTAVTGSNAQAVGTRNLSPAQLAAFQTYDVSSTRQNSKFNAGFILDPHWAFQFDYNHLDQSGAKLIAGSSNDARTALGASGTWAKEAMVTLMNPTNYRTDSFNLAANWTGSDAYATASYYASYFRNANDRLYWDNPIGTGSATTGAITTTLAGGYQPNMLSVMPGNDFHQLNLNGGYALSARTKLVGGISYGQGTQNEAYLVDANVLQTGGLPRGSLDGLVITSSANLRLTDQTTKDLSLSAGMRYNRRDNRTASAVYQIFDIGGGPAVAANSGTRRLEINTPYSYSKNVLELAGDYRLDRQRTIRMAYDHEDVRRWCNSVAGAAAPNPAVVGVIAGNVASPADANCVVVPGTNEDKLAFNYRARASDAVNYTAGYTYSNRVATNVDHNALTPLNDQAGANGTGIVNASDYKGYMAFFDASRNQNLVKAGINWQASEAVALSVGGRYAIDVYQDSPLGVQNGHSMGFDLDASYSYSESGTLTAYFASQDRDRIMLSGASGAGATDNATSYAALVSPKNIWRNVLTDSDRTVGLNLRQKGLMGGKLELVGDLSVSIAQSQYHTDVPYYVATATAPSCASSTSLSCGDTPAIFSNTLQVKLIGNYQLDKKSQVSVGYQYQRLMSNDYYYNALQYGYTPSTTLPTNQQPSDYTVNALAVSYVYKF